MSASVILVAAIATAVTIVVLLAVAGALLLARSRLVAREESILLQQIPSCLEAMRAEMRTSLDGTTQTLNQRMAQLSGDVDRRLSDVGGEVGRRLESTSGMIGDRLDGAVRVVAEVHRRLGTVQGVTERVFEVGKQIASLQETLRAPKLRGGLGELFLGDLLDQVLPAGSFELQHAFRGGQRVDAVVKLGEKLVPVDAKFPYENFVRISSATDDAGRSLARRAFLADVKKRIDEIASKYILPEEGTFDFALMYVPAENVYYETIIREEDGGAALHEYSLARRVIPVSPNTLFSYLQVILLGLRGLRIEESAHEILRGLGGVTGEIERFRQEFQILGKHIEDASKKYGEASRRLQRVEESVERLESRSDAPGAAGSPAGKVGQQDGTRGREGKGERAMEVQRVAVARAEDTGR